MKHAYSVDTFRNSGEKRGRAAIVVLLAATVLFVLGMDAVTVDVVGDPGLGVNLESNFMARASDELGAEDRKEQLRTLCAAGFP